MTRSRLPWLLAAAAGLSLLRWWAPPGTVGEGANEGAEVVVQAVQRAPAPPDVATPEAGSPFAVARGQVASTPEPIDLPGNAFPVRVAVNAYVPPPPMLLPAKPVGFMGPPAPVPEPPPPPPPPPPLQVIGTWDDGAAPGVFIASGQGTVLARVGTVILAEYKVTAVTPQHVAITRISSRYEWRLPIPRAGSNR